MINKQKKETLLMEKFSSFVSEYPSNQRLIWSEILKHLGKSLDVIIQSFPNLYEQIKVTINSHNTLRKEKIIDQYKEAAIRVIDSNRAIGVYTRYKDVAKEIGIKKKTLEMYPDVIEFIKQYRCG